MGDDVAEASTLKRDVTGLLLFMFILGDVLGAGVYALVGSIAGEVGGVTWVPLLVALGMALLTAASYAELVTKYPRAGGSAVFAQRAFRSDFVSYMVGFCMLAAGVVSAAALALAFSGDYLATFIDLPPIVGAIILLVLIAAINLRGVKESLRSNLVMTCIELSGLLLIVVLVAILLGNGGGDVARAVSFAPGVEPWSAVLGAALLAFYSYVGFETSANMVEELRDPSRTYPRALFASLLAAGILYVLVGTAASIAVPADELAASSGPLLTVIEATEVPVPAWLFSAIALIAVANGALLTMIMASRLTYGMSNQGLLPRALGRVLPRRRTPWVAILVTTGAAILLALTGTVEVLAETVVILLLVVFLSTNIAVLVLRRDRVKHEHFRTWTALPVLAVITCLVLLTQQSGEVWLRGGIIVLVGVITYVILRLARRGKTKTSSGPASEDAQEHTLER
ncbi:amino acid permease [Pseudoclavibacter endophyticus]|uniref:Amino acid permease n=1 Tax=Pseudoclavibacter endophyticus TaxID=1778590 RepID=A0A6H9WN50_9MICO|nr:APC family permease [Pseudoclavibacter endophyticus]KAB1646665.1 amino acid permease [Pseudoclavibacter endophyticus]GGA76672.1 amino acid permease [Pseudoclavibacter endophyticus]